MPPIAVPLAISDESLSPYQLPAGSIIAGDPRPRGHVICELESDGVRLVTGVYACDPGSVRATGVSTETIHVLEGTASIEFANGSRVDVHPGDVVVIPPGHETTWIFHSVFREMFVLTG